MYTKHKHHIRSIATLASVLAVLLVGTEYQKQHDPLAASELMRQWTAQVGSNRTFSVRQRQQYPNKPEYRIALRLQQRLRKRGTRAAPTIQALASAVKQRQELLGKTVEVTFETEENQDHTVWTVSPQRYPLIIEPKFNITKAEFTINAARIAEALQQDTILAGVPAPVHATLTAVRWSDDPDVMSRVEVDGVAKPGYLPDSKLIAASVQKAFIADMPAIRIPLPKVNGRIINMTNEDLGDLTLWSRGLSNYKGSTYARKHNVHKALHEHVNNTIVRPGELYSFNNTLDGPVSQGNGWAMAKVIFNGGDLEFAPGGGICQASTTVFRAAVNAGLPIKERRAHSLYVTYYKEHGVGIDATIFPGSQDLVFENDTNKPIVVQAYNNGDDAFVSIFGSPDGRTVELKGPYFTATAPEGYLYNGRGIKTNEIVWDQTVHYTSGHIEHYQIGSRYKTMPQTLAREYAPDVTLHTAAPLAEMKESDRLSADVTP